MVFNLDGGSEYVSQAWRKKAFSEKKISFVPALGLSNALNRSNNKDCTLPHVPYREVYHVLILPINQMNKALFFVLQTFTFLYIFQFEDVKALELFLMHWNSLKMAL